MKKRSSKLKRSSIKKKAIYSSFFGSLHKFPLVFKGKSLDIFFILLSLIITGYAWRSLPDMVIRSDGFLHMLSSEQQRFWSQTYWITGYEIEASILGAVLPKFFGANVSMYLWFEWIFILLIVLLLYFLIRVITQSSVIAFASTLIAGVSYFGNWDMYGTHCYCFFFERVTNIPFLLASFLSLHFYLIKRKKLYLALSFLLYFVGLKLGHLALILTPPFFLYQFFLYVMHVFKKETWKGLLIGAVFFIISVGVVFAQQVVYPGWGPKWTFTEFVLNPWKYNYFKVMALQLTYWSQYYSILPNLYSVNPLRDIDLRNAEMAIPFVLIIYSFIFFIIFKNLQKLRVLLLTVLFGFLGISFLSSYVRINEVVTADSNRYLYYPTFFLSIFWGIALWYFFLSRGKVLRMFGVLIIFFYLHVNILLLEHIVNRNLEWNKSTKVLFDYVLQSRNELSTNTLVVVSYPEFWVQEKNFFTEQLGRGEVVYATESTAYGNWKNKIHNYKHVINLKYDQSCDCVRETKIK